MRRRLPSARCFFLPTVAVGLLSTSLPAAAQLQRPGQGRSLYGDTPPPVASPTSAGSVSGAPRGVRQGTPQKVAVMRTLVDGVDPGVGAQVSARIAEVTRRSLGAEVLSAEEIQTLLEHERDKQLSGCEQESCLAEVADALGADIIVQARLSRIEGGYALTLSALDAVHAQPVGRVDEQWGGEPLLLLDLIRPSVDRLFAVGGVAPTGVVTIDGVKDGSRIIVDDVVRGTAPAGQLALPVGAHRLSLTLEGHETVQQWIIVNQGAPMTLPVQQLALSDDAFYETWWFWTAVGGGVAVAVAGTAGAALLLNDGGGGTPGKTGVNVAVNADQALGGAR